MHVISHPERFQCGTRVLFLNGRKKDGVQDLRTISRVTHAPEKFASVLAELVTLLRPGERIYASADARDVSAAARHFRHAQIDADHEADPMNFYHHIATRWCSSLMQTTSRAEKNWLFDCDTEEMYAQLNAKLAEIGVDSYTYGTKNGHHIITRAFDRRVLAQDELAIWVDNSLMLWAYS